MKDKSKIFLVAVILVIAAIIAYVCYGITKGAKNPVVTMEVSYLDKDGNEKNGTVKIELYPEHAPESVANFVNLTNNGFYNGLTFHRIEKDFVVQGGDKKGDGTGSAKLSDLDKSVQAGSSNDYTYSIKGEFYANGINNTLKFEKGVVGMARSDYSSYGLTEEGYNSASTQFFFVTTDDNTKLNSLNKLYAPFGKVIEGYEYVEEISSLYAKDDSETASKDSSNKSENTEESTESSEENKNVPKIKNVTVDTFGAKYALPKTINMDKTMQTVQQYQNYYQQMMSGANSSDSSQISTSTAE